MTFTLKYVAIIVSFGVVNSVVAIRLTCDFIKWIKSINETIIEVETCRNLIKNQQRQIDLLKQVVESHEENIKHLYICCQPQKEEQEEGSKTDTNELYADGVLMNGDHAIKNVMQAQYRMSLRDLMNCMNRDIRQESLMDAVNSANRDIQYSTARYLLEQGVTLIPSDEWLRAIKLKGGRATIYEYCSL